jgi:transposase-like protein
MHTTETKDKFIELRLKGASLADIAKKIGVSKTTLVDWNQRYADELRALRSAELESLHDRILQSYEADFTRLSRMQENVEKLAYSDKFCLWMMDAVRGGQIVRKQIRELRKDIASFGRLTNDIKKPTPPSQPAVPEPKADAPSKSQTSNADTTDSTPPSTTSIDKT